MQEDQAIQWLRDHAQSLSLLDGVQRTVALQEAAEMAELTDYCIRVELWVARTANELIYRMLVLAPRDIRRQVETVFAVILRQIQSIVPGIVVYKDDECRRSAEHYRSDDILELYLAFCSRKEKFDRKERLSDVFVRLDFLDVTSAGDSIQQFAEALSLLGKLDQSFARATCAEEYGSFRTGTDVFRSLPACVGFHRGYCDPNVGKAGKRPK